MVCESATRRCRGVCTWSDHKAGHSAGDFACHVPPYCSRASQTPWHTCYSGIVCVTYWSCSQSQDWTSQAFLDALLQAMRAFQSNQMAMAEHLHADVATVQQLKDTGKQLL